ncbi:MAG: hypothetical protein LLF28_06500 [Nitrospiraceae bacterium]|nr:hypothetical protein [Nitrospiraceae bacterium]
MVFGYYKRLTANQKRIYDKSDSIAAVKLPSAADFLPLVNAIEQALKKEDRGNIEMLSQKLIIALASRLRTPGIKMSVLAVRPHNSRGELHGLYNPAERNSPSKITIWMRTAQQKRIVAFKTFLRTVLHELCHHLDYELYGFSDSFHTQGFYKRESSILKQLLVDRQ